MRLRARCFTAFVVVVCDSLRYVARLLFRACCVVFVRVCFATSVLMRVFVCFVCDVLCGGVWCIVVCVSCVCVCLMFSAFVC